MGTTQHVANLLAIADEGGLALHNGDRLIPDLLLVGRDADRLKALAAAKGGQRWTTSLDEALSGPDAIFMDCAATGGRPARVRKANYCRQAHSYREADCPNGRRGHGAGMRGTVRRTQARSDPGQAVSAWIRQAAVRQKWRLLWPHTLHPHRCRVLDIRWKDAGMPTAELELQAQRVAVSRSI
jgi:hypothetical protein